MRILGLHFGHDAAVAVIEDGRILSYVLKERHSRVKHALGLDAGLAARALDDAGVQASQIDFCAVCSTQGVELLATDGGELRVELARHARHTTPCSFEQQLQRDGRSIEEQLTSTLLDSIYGEEHRGAWLREAWLMMFPEHRGKSPQDFAATGCIDTFITEPGWDTGATFEQLRNTPIELRDDWRFGFHYPAVVHLAGTALPAYFVHHHLAHAGCSYYTSGFDQAAILTHDGYLDGESYHSGMYYYGRGNALYPLGPHHLAIGSLYDRAGAALGLGAIGAAGKLMGLAAYGEPRFYDPEFVGNFYDHAARFKNDPASAWMYRCVSQLRRSGADMSRFGDPTYATEAVNADVAASTQKLFEETRSEAVAVLAELLGHSHLATPNLCLSGGTALNCPSNTLVASQGAFDRVWVEPACDDSGLAIGAALAVHHSILDQPLPSSRRGLPEPYLGVRHEASEIAQALAAVADQVIATPCDDAAARAGEDLSQDRLVGWFEGRSEAGPRALGHRSILADPRKLENWQRVNRLKSREAWRPLAPAVLQEEAHLWFEGAPLPSPYMLFNTDLKSQDVPAITHVDGSARVQTVDATCGGYYRVLTSFFERTGTPVVLNTSFNGPAEPIVETPRQALAFLLTGELDVLYLETHRVVRRV